jgi:phage shock protein A
VEGHQALVEVPRHEAARAHEENADPKVQLEQAIQEAKEQHKRLTEQAANVIANQNKHSFDSTVRSRIRQGELVGPAGPSARGSRARSGSEAKARASARPPKCSRTSCSSSNVSCGARPAAAPGDGAAENAKAAVSQNRQPCEEARRKEQLLSTLDQANMQEAMNKAMAQLTSTIGDDVPTFEEVRKKIDVRLARAQGMAELNEMQAGSSIDARILEVERAQMSSEAQARLSELRSELGLSAPEAPTSAPMLEVSDG